MAEMTIGEVVDVEPEIGTGSIFTTGNRLEQERELNESREAATLGETTESFYDQALKDNVLGKIVDYGAEQYYTDFKKDENYVMDDTIALGILNANQLPIKYFADVRGSTSEAEMNFRIAQASREANTEEKINSTLSENTRVGASITGALLDIDIVAGLGVGMVTKGSSLAKIMAYDGVTETSLVATRYMVNDNYTVEDAVFDMTVGLAITAGASKLVQSFQKPKDVGTPKNDDAMDIEARTKATAEQDVRKAMDDTDIMEEARGGTRTADDVEVRRQTQGTKEFEAERVRTKEARYDLRKSVGLTDAKINKLEARRAKQEAEGMSIDDIRRADEEDNILGVSPSTYKAMNIVEDMTGGIKQIKDDMVDVIKASPKEDVADLKKVIDDLVASNPEQFSELNKIVKSKSINKGFAKVFNTIEGMDLSPSAKKKLLAVGAIGTATSATAAEDDDNIATELTGAFLLLASAFVLAPSAISKIRNANLRESIRNVGDKISKVYHKAEVNNSPQASMIRKTGALIADGLSTRITSTVAPFNKAGGNAKKVMNDLVYSARTGAGAETTKAMWAHGTMFKYSTYEKQAFTAWKAEKGITTTSNILNDMSGIHVFRKELTDNMELRNSTSPAINKMTAQNDELMQGIWDKVKEYEVYGFDKINYVSKDKNGKGMIPRLWNSGNMNTLLNKISDTDQLKVRDSIANAIAKTSGDPVTAQKVADRYLASWKKGFDNDMSVSRAEDVFGSVKGLFKDDVDFDDFADAMAIPKDKNARAKYRVDFDVNDIENVTVNIDGVDTLLDKSAYLERDFKTILDRVSNSMYGSAAIAKKGYKSVAALNLAIDGVTTPLMRRELAQVRDLVLGIPIPSNNKFLHEISMISKDLTMVAKLPFVVFSMPPELLATLGNAGFKKGAQALVESVKSTFGTNSAMLTSLSEVTGLGTGLRRLDWSGYRGLTDDITNLDDAGVTSAIRSGTMRLRDFSMVANGLSYFSDVLQRANLQLNAEKFANFVNEGTSGAKGINASRLQGFGIDDETIKMFQDTFKFNDKGRLQEYDISKWSIKKQDRFGEVLRDMNQAVSPETTIGETGLYTKTTDLGRMMSSLISYPMQQFNIHGLEDLPHFDRMTFMHSVGGFAGAYIGLQSRYAAQGKEVDDEQVMLYALMNVPQMGGLSAITSMASPATLDTVQSALNVVGMGRR